MPNAWRCFFIARALSTKNKTTVVIYIKEQVGNQLGIKKEEIEYDGFVETRGSYLFKFKICTSSARAMNMRKIVVKLHKSKNSVDVLSSQSENSYKFLKQLNYLLSDTPQIVIPKPIARLPRLNSVVREYVNGASLQSLMRSGGRFSSQNKNELLEACFRNTGTAIGTIHAKTYSPNASEAKLNMERKLRIIQSQIQYSHFRNSKTVKRALEYINKAIPNINWERSGNVWTHGDFVHSNVLITDTNQVAIVDFAESRFDSPYHDISRFTARTVIDYGYNQLKYSPKYIEELNHNFLNGYLSSFQHRLSGDLFLVYSIFNMLQSVSFLYEQDFSKLLSLRDWYALFLIKEYTKDVHLVR